jgi:hypothetical protein
MDKFTVKLPKVDPATDSVESSILAEYIIRQLVGNGSLGYGLGYNRHAQTQLPGPKFTKIRKQVLRESEV